MMNLLIRWLLSFATIEGIIRDELNLVECGCELLLRKVKDLSEGTRQLEQEVEAAMQFENNNFATVHVATQEGDINDGDEIISNDIVIANQALPVQHRIEPITIDLPMSKAMESPHDLCSFRACTDYINLFSRGQQYHLLSNVHAPTLPQQKCRQAFIVSSMPYAGSELQMLLIEKMLTKAGKKFRSHVYYNFHAHAELGGRISLQWMEDFNDFLSTLDEEDFLVIRVPYRDDDESASQLCSSSIKLNSMRSLVDIALLRFYRNDVASSGELPVMNLKEIMDYIRTLLMHQRYWAKNALNVDMVVDDKDGMMRFLSQICEQIGDIDCNDYASEFEDLVESNEIVDAVKVMADQEIYLRNIYNSTADETKRVQNEVSQVFRSWIESHAYY